MKEDIDVAGLPELPREPAELLPNPVEFAVFQRRSKQGKGDPQPAHGNAHLVQRRWLLLVCDNSLILLKMAKAAQGDNLHRFGRRHLRRNLCRFCLGHLARLRVQVRRRTPVPREKLGRFGPERPSVAIKRQVKFVNHEASASKSGALISYREQPFSALPSVLERFRHQSVRNSKQMGRNAVILAAIRRSVFLLPLQTGALPWRLADSREPEVLLVTGRRSGRWMIPKGWPMIGRSLADAAKREAYEEAGVSGTIDPRPLGSFRHLKRSFLGEMEIEILVHPMAVEDELADWPERGQRLRKWFPLKKAGAQVESKELRNLITALGKRLKQPRT